MTIAYPKVRFLGRSKGYGGYSHATRYIAEAFSRSKIPVLFDSEEPFYKNMSTHSGPCDIDFYIHTPPFSKYKSKNYKIGYFYWEADRLPRSWERDICTGLNEIWVPCNLTKKACRKAGFSGPIEVVHTPRPASLNAEPVSIPYKGSKTLAVGENTFIFYSIFQWNKRKGYRKLLRAYYEEFSDEDDVLLVIKTYPIKHPDHGMPRIKEDLLTLKRYSKNSRSAPVFLVTNKLSDEHMAGLHDIGNCFVLPHHGEGWGMPIHDAMMHSSLVVTTGYGGITEHLNDSNSLLIKHKLIEVKPMSWTPLYQPYQRWADPDILHLKSQMRTAYSQDKQKTFDLTSRARRVAESMDIKAFSINIENIFSQNRHLKGLRHK
jgi:hypothetical protein